MQYRPEVDGLRAVAVLPVILFHAGFSAFSGGFVGVDVFFVISGYLITTIIYREMAQGRFSIWRFYERRARRILPALFAVLLACIPFAWLWMLPSEFKDFSQSLVGAATFSSNILFWRESGYFAAAAELKPLLHTWSLAVEEQFYILYPPLLLALYRFIPKRLSLIIILGVLISLGLAQWASTIYPSANFYLLPTRAWELGVGALVAIHLHRLHTAAISQEAVVSETSTFLARPLREAAGITGLALIGYAIFTFDEGTPFPSFWTLIPVVGTALIILAADRDTLIGNLLSLRLLVGIGLISFSAYLWHQPLLSFARIRALNHPLPEIMFGLAVLSLVLAFLTWKYIEQPFRSGNSKFDLSRRKVFIYSGVVSAAFISFGLYGHVSNGVQSRVSLPKSLERDLYIREYQEKCFDFSMSEIDRKGIFCHLGDKTSLPKVAIIGDSHSLSFIGPLSKYFEEREISFIFSGVSGCVPMIDTYVLRNDARRDVCAYRNENVYQEIVDKGIEKVILIARWTYYSTGDISGGFINIGNSYEVKEDRENSLKVFSEKLKETLNFLMSSGIEVVVFHQPPVQETDARSFYSWVSMFGDDRFEEYLKEISVKEYVHERRYAQVRDLIEEKVSSFNNAKSVDFSPYLCRNGICDIGQSNRSYYFDDDHLSNYGASILIEKFGDSNF